MVSAFPGCIQRLIPKPAIQILFIILSGAIVYSNTFDVPFVLDDYHTIVDNGKLANLSTFLASDLFPSTRWFALASFAINKGLGGLEVSGFHAINLSIHLGTGLVVYFLAKTTISSFGEIAADRYAFAPLVASIGFVLHPLHTQSVTYIVQRMTSLATLLYLSVFLLYALVFLEGTATEKVSRARSLMLYLLAIISCLLAMSTKEISYTLPVVLAMYDICFLKGAARQRTLRLVPFFICMLLMSLYLIGPLKGVDLFVHGGGDEFSYPLPRTTYLITELCVLSTYMRLLVLPTGQNLDYDYPIFTSLVQLQAAAAFILIVAVLWAGIFLLKRSFASKCSSPALLRICGFSIAWFYITISVESGLLPLIDTIFEHRVYLPSVWFFVALGMFVCELYRRTVINGSAVVLVIIALLVLSGYATYRRNNVWRDTLTLWSDVVEKSPKKTRGWTELGIYFINRRDPARAIPLLERAVSLNPDYFIAHSWLGRALAQSGDLDRALEHDLITTRLAPRFSKGWESAGRILLLKGRVREAAFFLNRAREIDPGGFDSHEHLQQALSRVALPSQLKH